MARNKKVEILSHDGQVLHPITDGDCVIFPDGETLARKLSEQEEVMYTPEVVNSSPMFKVGEGDSSDYSANVLDGAYQEAVLKGQTYVNTIQEPSADVITLPTPFTEYERTQSKTFTEMQDGTFGLNLVGQSYVNCIQEPSKENYVALGEALEFQNKKVEYTNDGQIKSAILKGQTLVNLALDRFKSVQISTNETITSGPNSRYILAHFSQDASLKPNTKYHLRLNSKFISGDTEAEHFKICWYKVEDGTRTYLSETGFYTPENGLYKISFTTPNDCNSITLALNRRTDSGIHTSTYEYSNGLLLEYQEGMENWDIPYFQGMQSVTMSTELENVCSRYNSSGAKNGKTFTVGTWETRGLTLSTKDNISKYNFKPNTKYLVQFKVTNLNLDGLSSIGIAFSDGEVSTGNSLFGDNALVEVKSNGIYRGILTTSNVISTSNFVIKGLKNQWENSTSTTRKLTISQIMCIEYQNGMENWDLPYFETTQLMKPLKVQSVNKNIYDKEKSKLQSHTSVTFEGEAVSFYQGTQRFCLIPSVPFKENTQYTLSYTILQGVGNILFTYTDNTWSRVQGEGTSNSGKTVKRIESEWTDGAHSIISNIQLEELGTATDYIPHQSKTTSALEPITLRAIGNVKDTLDLSTGEYVQRIREMELDGSNDEGWVLYNNSTTNTISFRIDLPNGKRNVPSDAVRYLCDKFPVLPQTTALNNKETEWTFYNLNGNCIIFFSILRSKLTTEDLAGFKNYLSQNPVKIQFEMANPITRKISLEYPNLQTYQDITHVQSIAMDGTLIPNIYLPSDISYKAMLKPNTSYNVIVDREVIDSTNQLTVNLGGTTANITANRTVVRTPSTLSNETLTFSGKDNRLAKAMLIEGSTLINGDLPHFDGIGDVKLGRVVENLCMANESYAGSSATTNTLTNNEITCKATSAGSRVVLFDFTKPIQNGKKYFVYAPCSKMLAIGIRTFYNNITYYDVAKTNITNYAILSVDNSILNDCKLFIGELGTLAVNATMTIRRPILCEYIDGMENWDWESIGYFTGTRNIGNEFMRIGNKNLFDKDEFAKRVTKLSGNNTLDGDILSYDTYTTYRKRLIDGVFKPNTRYTIKFNVTINAENKNFILIWRYTDGTESLTSIGGNNKIGTFTLTLTSQPNKTIDYFYTSYGYGTIVSVDLSKIQLEEATSATSYVAHKHNSLHILPNEQIPLTFVQGTIAYAHNGTWENAINNTNTARIRTQLLDLEPNETYRVSCGHSNHGFGCQGYDNSLLAKSDSGWTYGEYYFTTTKDVHKYAINVRYKDNSNISPSVLHQVRLEKVTDITLRSVGDVKDELDLTRGVYIQRMYEVKLNGFEDWSIHNAYSTDNHLCFYWGYKKIPSYDYNKFGQWGCVINVTPLLIPRGWNSFYGAKADEEGVTFNGDNKQNITIKIRKDRLSSQDVNGFKQWLQSNPITVQYPLETPIEHKINIPMKNELNQTIAKPNGVFTLPLMYSETNHVDINSQIYPKVQSRDYISYPVIANNSQLHTVFHNKLGTGNLTVNLCGTSVTSVDGTSKCAVTTPSTISQYELRLSGARNKVSNVCVFSGDYMNVNVPYVQGMMNAANPIVKNIGKNLFDGKLEQGAINTNYGNLIVTTTAIRCTNYIKLKQNTTYTISKSKGTKTITILFYDRNKSFIEAGWSSTFTLRNDAYYIKFTDGENDLTNNYQIEESSTLSQYEPYKENIVKIYEKPLFDGEWELGSYDGNGSETNNNTVSRNKNKFIKVQPNSTIVATYYCVIHEYDENKNFIKFGTYDYTNKVTLSGRTNYINFRTLNKTTSNNSEYNNFNIQLVSEIITLRSLPNGVRDELNLQTGEYIQRIGEVVFDGSDDENWNTYEDAGSWDNNFVLGLKIKIPDDCSILEKDSNNNFNMICNRYQFCWSKSDIGNLKEGISVYNSDRVYFISIYRKIVDSIQDFKKYIQANPIIIQYQLATPIVKQIDINNSPHSYKDGHVIIESNDPSTNVTAQMTYRCVTNRSGQIQEHTEQVEKQERQINELETLILENIRLSQNRSQNFLTSLISTLEIEEE